MKATPKGRVYEISEKVNSIQEASNNSVDVVSSDNLVNSMVASTQEVASKIDPTLVNSLIPNRKVPKHALSVGLHKVMKKKSPVKSPSVLSRLMELDIPPTEAMPRKVSRNRCIVPDCKRPLDVCLHRFPQEEHQTNFWLKRLQINDSFTSEQVQKKNLKVCSLHFQPEDYEVITNVHGIKILSNTLKKNAFPRVNIPLDPRKPLFPTRQDPKKEEPTESSAKAKTLTEVLEDNIGIHFEEFESVQEERNYNRNVNKEANKEPEDSNIKDDPPKEETTTKDGGVQHSPVKEVKKAKFSKETNEAKDPRDERIKELEALVKAQKCIIQAKDRKIKRLDFKAKNPSKAVIKQQLTQILEERKVPKSQIRCLVHNKKYTFFRNDPDGLAKAAVEFAINSRLYNHLRKTEGSLYRPHPTTIARHFEHFQVTSGFQDDSIDVLEKMAQKTENKLYRHALLAFDEVAIKGDEVEMDKRTQTVYGPYSKMQVVSIRGLGPK